MAITSMDDLMSEIASGKSWRSDWNKITGAAAYAVGRWYDMSPLNGTPVANAWSGTALAFQDTNSGSGHSIYHGGNVSADTKHLLNMAAVTGVATGVPSVLMLVDMIGYYPGINANTALSQTLTGTPTHRYTGGQGVRAYLVPTATIGAATQNITLSYTDQDDNDSAALPVTVTTTASAIVPHISHSGTAGNNYGPFLPLASGDTGVRSVQSIQFSGATTGTYALVLARPIATLPLTTISIGAERDLLNQMPSLPRIPDGACLSFLYFAGAATAASTNFYGSLEFAWG